MEGDVVVAVVSVVVGVVVSVVVCMELVTGINKAHGMIGGVYVFVVV